MFPYLKEEDDTPQVDLHALTGGAVAPAVSPGQDHQPAPIQSMSSIAGPPRPPTSQPAQPQPDQSQPDNPPIQTLGGMQDDNAVFNRIDSNAPAAAPQAQDAPPMQQQALTALGSPTMAAPENSPKAMKAAEKEANKPKFTPRYANPQNEAQVAANKEAENTFNIDNAQNQDHGVKGKIRELLQNFFYGLAQTPQGADWKQALVLGGAGVGGGLLSPSWNERRQAEQNAPRLRQQTQDAEKRVAQQSAIDARNMQTNLQIDKATRDRISAQQKPYLDQWDKKPSFDPVNNPEDKAFAEEALKNGVRLTTKTPNGKYSTTIDAKSGSVVVTNTMTGDYKIQEGAVPRPPETDTDYKKQYSDWQKTTRADTAAAQKLILDGQSEQNTAAEWEKQAAERLKKDPYDAGALKLKADAAAKRASGNAKVQQGNEKRASLPPEPKKPESPKPYAGLVVTAQNWPAIKAKFPGKSDIEIRDIITANGGSFAK